MMPRPSPLFRRFTPSVALCAALVAAAACDIGKEDTPAGTDKAPAAEAPAAEAPVAKAEAPAPIAVGSERGACYGNGTCNEGLTCLSNLCVEPTPAPDDIAKEVAADGDKPTVEAPEIVAEVVAEAPAPGPFDVFYLGTYGLGVNRVNDGRRNRATATITREDGLLQLSGSVAKGRYDLTLSGVVTPVSEKEFVLDGTLSGTPDLSFLGRRPTPQETVGKFTFRATKGRRYWRLFEVDGKRCVCDEGCGNDFCYVDVGPKK